MTISGMIWTARNNLRSFSIKQTHEESITNQNLPILHPSLHIGTKMYSKSFGIISASTT